MRQLLLALIRRKPSWFKWLYPDLVWGKDLSADTQALLKMSNFEFEARLAMCDDAYIYKLRDALREKTQSTVQN